MGAGKRTNKTESINSYPKEWRCIRRPVNRFLETKKLQLPSGTWSSSRPAGGKTLPPAPPPTYELPLPWCSAPHRSAESRATSLRRTGKTTHLPHGFRGYPASGGRRRGRLPALPRFLAAGAAAEGPDAALRGGGAARGPADAGWGGGRSRRRRAGGVGARRCSRPGRRAARLPSSAIRPPEPSSVERGLRSDLVLGTGVPEAPQGAWAPSAPASIAHTNFELLVSVSWALGYWGTKVEEILKSNLASH